MATWRTAMRIPILFLIVATLMLAAAIGFYVGQAGADSTFGAELLRHEEDGKPATEACENANERAKANDSAFAEGCEEKPPEGRYGDPHDDDDDDDDDDDRGRDDDDDDRGRGRD